MLLNHPRFITFEGGEAVGKTTQIHLLKDSLEKDGYPVLLTREPGGTKKAEIIRNKLLNPENHFTLRQEIEAHFQARYDHVNTLIRPALNAGIIVLCDRFTDSTFAYQGYVRGRGNEDVLSYIEKLQNKLNLTPTKTFLLYAQWSSVAARLREREHGSVKKMDRYEQDYDRCFDELTEAFQKIAHMNPQRITSIDTSKQTEHAVHLEILTEIGVLLGQEERRC